MDKAKIEEETMVAYGDEEGDIEDEAGSIWNETYYV